MSLSSNSSLAYQVSENNITLLYNLSSLSNCTFPCKTCSNGLCLKCYSSIMTPLFLLDASIHACVSALNCSVGTYADLPRSACSLCPLACSSCSSSSICSACASNYYLINGSCLTDCPPAYYPISAQQVCSLCSSGNNSAHCLNCVSLNKCSSCLSPYLLDSSTQVCVASCNITQVGINGSCHSCLSPCASCLNLTTLCTSCLSGYYFYSGQCLPACPSPLVSDSSSICVSCSTSCLSCSTSPSLCTSCTYPLKLLASVCLNDCPVTYYTSSPSSNTLQCLLCPSPCVNCTSPSACQSCQSGYYLLSGSCLLSCPASYFPSTSTSGGVLLCASCSSNCLFCISLASCSQCQPTFYITSTNTSSNGSTNTTGSICASSCSPGQYLSSSACLPCPSNCVTCLSSSVCLGCTASTFLLQGACVSACGSGLAGVSVTYLYLSASIITLQCQECGTLYLNCLTCNNVTCTACLPTHVLSVNLTGFNSTNNYCALTCPTGYLNVSGICSACSPECSSCTVLPANCSSCTIPYLLYRNTTTLLDRCLTVCPSSTYNLSGECQSCVSPCLTCAVSPSSCLTCQSPFYLLNDSSTTSTITSIQCVSSCPSNAYAYQSSCIYCNADCATCDSTGCLRCAPGYYSSPGTLLGNLSYHVCYRSCPSSLPFLSNSTCLPCSANCLQCNATNCLQCATGWLGFNSFCLSLCPPSYGAVNGICVLNANTTNSNGSTLNDSIGSEALVPVPFSIVTAGLCACVLVSKYVHAETIVTIAVFAVVSLMCALCNVFYVLRGIIGQPYVSFLPYLYLLIIGVVFSYVNNIIYLFVKKFTLERDDLFLLWRRGNVHLIKDEQPSHGNLEPSHEQLEDHLNAVDS
jgi:proprotein convertase subtilisin/kexin type 5